MKRSLVFLFLLAWTVGCATAEVRDGRPQGANFAPDDYHRVAFTEKGQAIEPAPAELVNTLMGTDSIFSYSHGNVYPAVALPWGMNFWSPQTGPNGNGWMYTYRGTRIRGFRLTHQPCPWMADYATFSVMPMTGVLRRDQYTRAASFSHSSEIAKPYYYRVRLEPGGVITEITATERAGIVRFTFPKDAWAFVVLDTIMGPAKVKVDRRNRRVTGYVTNNNYRGGVPRNFKHHFIVSCDASWKLAGADCKGAWIAFPRGTTVVNLRIASSFISPEQAERNLAELGDRDFEAVMADGKEIWNRELSRIMVRGNLHDRAVFYSCLYRVLLFPRKFYEIDGQGRPYYYSPYDGKVHQGYMFTDNGFWDTFRAVYPFFTIMYPEMDAQVLQALVSAYNEGGWLPAWASPGYQPGMIGAHAASLFADGYIKGIRDFDAETAWQAMVKDANEPDRKRFYRGRVDGDLYNRYGYIPFDKGSSQNVARTLEYAYDDFCMARFAKAAGRPEADWEVYQERAMNYRNLFDPSVGFMCGKDSKGRWRRNFKEFGWGGDYTEGGPWHYTWSVFQDPAGLMDLFGGRDMFLAKMDAIFTTPAVGDWSKLGYKIHELREMEAGGMGQYAHGNQPIQHVIFFYDWAGEPWKAQTRSRETIARLYTPFPNGYCGDEDNGQTSAWLVFAALGMYPVCPGVPQYALGSPLFESATLSLPNGRTLTIEARGNAPDRVYIQSASRNGVAFTKNFLTHAELLEGGTIVYKMGPEPNVKRGVEPGDAPYSLSRDGF